MVRGLDQWRRLLSRLAPSTHAILRIAAALLFMEHGVQKLFGGLGGFGRGGGTVELFSLMGAAGVLDFFGGLLIALGLFTQPVAIVLVGEMAAAYVMVHRPYGGFPIQNGGEPALLYGLVFLFLAANGAGPMSLDRWMRRGWIRPGAAGGPPPGGPASAPGPSADHSNRENT